MSKFQIYLSYFLDKSTPLFVGEREIKMVPDRTINNCDTSNTSHFTLHNHSGKHIDFPNHFFDEGKVAQDYDESFWVFNEVYLLNKSTT